MCKHLEFKLMSLVALLLSERTFLHDSPFCSHFEPELLNHKPIVVLELHLLVGSVAVLISL